MPLVCHFPTTGGPADRGWPARVAPLPASVLSSSSAGTVRIVGGEPGVRAEAARRLDQQQSESVPCLSAARRLRVTPAGARRSGVRCRRADRAVRDGQRSAVSREDARGPAVGGDEATKHRRFVAAGLVADEGDVPGSSDRFARAAVSTSGHSRLRAVRSNTYRFARVCVIATARIVPIADCWQRHGVVDRRIWAKRSEENFRSRNPPFRQYLPEFPRSVAPGGSHKSPGSAGIAAAGL
jgi:hypothetical protein